MKKLILLTSDRSFIVPTLALCHELVNQAPVQEKADIILVVCGFEARELEIVQEVCEKLKVKIIHQDIDHDLLGTFFNPTHVPKSTLLRFSTPRHVEESYQQVLYIDGDVQIVGDITDLIDVEVPPDRMLAAPDRYVLGGLSFGWEAKIWKSDKSYMNMLGIRDPNTYFNAGVMAADRSSWSSLCREASEFFMRHSSLCRYHDQSALNAVCVGKTIALSPAYNFHTAFRQIEADNFLEPKIIHFTGAEKPWLPTSAAEDARRYASIWSRFSIDYPECFKTFTSKAEAMAVDGKRNQSLKNKIYVALARAQKRRAFRRYLSQRVS